MGKPWSWLRKELESWVAEGLIREDQAAAIRARYPQLEAPRPWGAIVFGGLGAVIVGLGIILLFAYNWAAMPKAAKLAVVFGALIAAHGGGLWLKWRTERFQGIGEALTILGTMMFGAGIWLVAQIYHIEEHYPNAYLWWGLGATAMAWALPSAFQGCLAAVLFATLGLNEAVAFGISRWSAPVLVLVLVPLAWRLRSRVLMALLVPGFILALCGPLGAWESHVVFHAIVAYTVFLMGIGYALRQSDRLASMGTLFLVYGCGAYFLSVYLLTFGDMADELLDQRLTLFSRAGLLCIALPALIGVAPWGWLLWRWVKTRPAPLGWPADMALAPLLLVLLTVWARHADGHGDELLLAAPSMFVFLAHAAMRMARGCRQAILRDTVIGAILLTVFVFARYFDLFDSLLSRGVAFIVLGGVLFAEGLLYARARKQLGQEGAA